jgi:hypothetical protein
MKKIIYSFAVLLAICFSGCEETDNLSEAGEKGPLVTIYSYTIPAGKDADATVNLRFRPNSDCAKFYVLIEKKADKDTFMASHDSIEYAAKVVASGKEYPAQDLDYLDESLAATYAITAVGVSTDGAKGRPVEFIFNGIEWGLIGNAIYTDPFSAALTNVPVKWYKSTNLATPIYKLEDRFAALGPGGEGYNIKLTWDANGKITFLSGQQSPRAGFWMLETPFTHATYGAYWEEVDLDPEYTYYDADNNYIQIEYRRVVSAGTFAGWYDIIIELP